MAITLIKGRPGAGKSYECVVHHILPSLRDGRKVVTNIPLNVDHFALLLGEEIRDLIEVHQFDFDSDQHYLSAPDDYKVYQEWRNDMGQGCLFVLDECHLLFPLQGRGKEHSQLAQEQIKFFSGHRHYGFDFIFLTQSDRKINRLLREDIEICIELRKNRAIGDSSYRRYVYYYGDGKRGGLIEQSSRKYEQKYFKLYSSHTKSESSVTEASVKDLKKWHQNWGLRIGFVLFIFGAFKLTGNLGTLFSEKPSPTTTATSHVANHPESNVPVKPSSPPTETSKQMPTTKDFVEIPFGQFKLYIEGYADFSYIDDNGLLHVQKHFDFLAINDAKHEIKLNLEDLYLAGYQVHVFGRCYVKLRYDEVERNIYCRGSKPDSQTTSNSVADLNPF